MVSSNTLTNIKMTNAIKGLVSKKKKRYKEDGFNLDLSYICDNIIAMGFPAKNLEGVYRNHIDDVINFLTKKHNNNYKIYNLCEEKKYQYDFNKFQQCASFPFYDHNPPNIELITSFCNDVHKWLCENEKNVAAIHCKAGKGRTGTMICCYLLHCGQFETAADALSFYGQKRTTDKKGVTIPSQRRYVEYYSSLLRLNKPYTKVAMNICEIKLYNLPSIRTFGTLTYSIIASGSKIHSDQLTDLKRIDNYVSIKLDRCMLLVGDIKIEFSCTQIMKHKQKLFHYWFNTFFVNEIPNSDADGNVIFELGKLEIDDAHKDKQKMFSENFKIETIFQRIPQGINHINRLQQHHNSNGMHNNVHPRDSSFRLSNYINNNASSNINNNINQQTSNHHHNVAEPQLQQSQSSDCALLRSNNSSVQRYQSSDNDNAQRRSENYQTTSEGSTSPESSSESSTEEWESVRYRLLSEPELTSLLKTTLSNGSLQSSNSLKAKGEPSLNETSSECIDSHDNLRNEPMSSRQLATDNNDNISHNRENNNLMETS
ncbi:CLUMA_CG000194, isoform B [Clunio marinus]|uniref:Phosphatidylinositol 3,4,5-trisphosphate 3-phosphatase and dual-specificity protein phosphatase PTEN n=1 Tax=Clunio marinus TaxID=568069 RepID=A0A1J1HJ67_9DIPT|nr:CLUMA_CG000194, isoform B [Clunio marinus]